MPGREFMGTQFGRMCQKLDMRIIAANSAPAKGRVERGNGTHQDRLINKMGRQKIRTHEAAQPVSAGRIFSRSQRSFCAGASGTAGLSSQGPKVREWEQVFCLETERSISNDWVVRYENRYFQMERSRLSAAAGEGEGVRVGRRADRDSVSGKGAATSGGRSAAGEATRSHPGGGEATGSSIPVGTAGEPPMAQGGARGGGDAAGYENRGHF